MPFDPPADPAGSPGYDSVAALAQMFVVLDHDGSVRVHEIPDEWPDQARVDIAQVAAGAAEQRLTSLVSRGRPLAPEDLHTVNLAARNAVLRHLASGDAA